MLKPNPEYLQLEKQHAETEDYQTTPSTAYVDEGGKHAKAAQELLAKANEQGVRTFPFNEDDLSFTETLNPNFRLPVAYRLAKKIYDLETAIAPEAGTGMAVGKTQEPNIAKMIGRLNNLLEQPARDPESVGEDELEAVQDLLLGSGSESLEYLLDEKFLVIEEQSIDIEGGGEIEPSQDDISVMCEALGQLCEDELELRLNQQEPSSSVLADETTSPQHQNTKTRIGTDMMDESQNYELMLLAEVTPVRFIIDETGKKTGAEQPNGKGGWKAVPTMLGRFSQAPEEFEVVGEKAFDEKVRDYAPTKVTTNLMANR